MAYVGVVGCVAGVDEMDWGGRARGDFERCDGSPRERERERIFALRALKKESSAGDVGVRVEREQGDVGEVISGEAVPDQWDFCEELVAVRRGGRGWKRSLP